MHKLFRILRKRRRPQKFLSFALIFALGTWPLPGQGKHISEDVTAPAVQSVVATEQLQSFPNIPDRFTVRQTITLTATAYSSTVDQTDADPFTTASGEKVRDGIIAYNFLPFGTRVRFPDRFGDKVFVVLDRMHPRKGRYVADIWMQTREQAIQWGARTVRMEVLGLL